MRSLRLMLSVVLLSFSAAAFAQSDAHRSFDTLKTLAGSWKGTVTTLPQQAAAQDKSVQISLRATSMGNALMHEMKVEGRPDDPITMLYLDSDRLLLTHYCDAGNRPRMVGTMTPDGKTVEFEFLDVAGGTQHGNQPVHGFPTYKHIFICSVRLRLQEAGLPSRPRGLNPAKPAQMAGWSWF